tara:strand:+ start:9312 stop:9509 length:198 start_codon:yes stop_codon:yes gene_type:complete
MLGNKIKKTINATVNSVLLTTDFFNRTRTFFKKLNILPILLPKCDGGAGTVLIIIDTIYYIFDVY